MDMATVAAIWYITLYIDIHYLAYQLRDVQQSLYVCKPFPDKL